LTTSNGTYPAQEKAEPPASWRAILEIVQALALAVVISVVLNLFVVQVTEVRQRSMEPTLLQNDRVLVSKVDYRVGAPAPCEIVVFNPPTDSAIPYVKRVIAIAGEKVDLRDGKVLVNGKARDCAEAQGTSTPQAPRITYPFTVPANNIWVMGDNRQASSDSRSFGPVPIENVIGKVLVRFWPFDRTRFFEW
jgi:signal peptidase I